MILDLPPDLRSKVLDLTDAESRSQLRLVSHAVKHAIDTRTRALVWRGDGKMDPRDVRRAAAAAGSVLSIKARGHRDGRQAVSAPVVKALAAVRFAQLRWIDLGGHRARAGSLDATMQHFARGNWPMLAALDLSGCGITGRGGAFLALAAWPRLRVLDVSDNRLGPRGASWITWPLKTLKLDGCGLGDEGVAALAAALATAPLLRLHLSRNEIGEAGARTLSRTGWKLQRLDLSVNALGPAGVAALAGAPWPLRDFAADYMFLGTDIVTWPALRTLTAHNALAFDPAAPAPSADVSALETLDLSFNSPPATRRVLFSREWPRLKALSLKNLDDETVMELFLGDTVFPALESLDLRCRSRSELALGTWMVLLEDSSRRFPRLRTCRGTSRYPQVRAQLVPRFNSYRSTHTRFHWEDLV
jgi:hypothetical protein